MIELKIVGNKVISGCDSFTPTTFAKAVGVYPSTVNHWALHRRLDLDQSPYEVVKQFWGMVTECTRCGKRCGPGMGHERWCQHCGEPRLKIGITYYVDHATGSDENDGVTRQAPFETSSKAMCRARKKEDRIVYAPIEREMVDYRQAKEVKSDG